MPSPWYMEVFMGSKKQREERAMKGGRRPTAVARSEPSERGRWSSGKKADVILRILRGESLDTLSRETGVTVARLAQWRDAFLFAGQVALKTRAQDVRDDEIGRLKAKVGELTMDNELLEEKIIRMEDGLHPAPRRPRR